MKKQTWISRWKAVMTLLLLLTASQGFSQTYRCDLKNISYPTPNTLEFDIYLQADGSNSYQIQSLQAGIEFNYAGLANGGTITGAWIPGSSSAMNAPQNDLTANVSVNATSKQFRLTAKIQTTQSLANAITPSSGSLKYGSFRLTNTAAFTQGATPNFIWSFITAGNRTKTALAGWTNGGAAAAAITTQTTGGTPNAQNLTAPYSYVAGPQHYVESNPPVPTSCPTVTAGTTTDPVCFGGTGSVVVNVTPASAGSYSVDGGTAVSFPSGTSFTVSGLSQGAHIISVTPGTCQPTSLNVSIGGPTSPLTNSTSQTSCDSYQWSVNGQTYTQSGTYTGTSTNSQGCTVNETLNLTINASTSNTSSATACDSYQWSVNGQTYTQSGTYTATSTNAAGCSHTETLNLTINASTSNTSSASACDSYQWSVNGMTYTQSGTYTATSTNAAGCPHTETLNLTITPSTTNTTSATACDSYTWSVNGQTYSATGSYSSTTGCNTEVLNLTINSSSSNSTSATACDSYTWSYNNTAYTASGTYTATGTNASGCPHTETLNLTINASTSNSTTASACDSYTWSVNGMTYSQSGTYTASSTNAAGCPHTETLNLTVNASTSNSSSATACDSYTWSANGMTYSQSGTYTATSTNTAGCPHTETLNLTINASTSNSTSATACDSYTWSVDGMTYSQSGTYTATSTNAAGCPHTETLNLTINASTSNSTSASACDSYMWSVNGMTYTQSGTYTATSTNTAGCPHTETLNLTINVAAPVTITSSNGLNLDCNNSSTVLSTTGGSTVWTQEGFYFGVANPILVTNFTNGPITYGVTVTDANGCTATSAIVINMSQPTSNTSSATACDSYTWSVNGMTYTQSGTYQSVTGCNTEILNLTINASTSNSSSATACDSYTWSVDGNTYTASGTYTATSTNTAGCPHTETLNLTINASTSNTTTATACDSYTWSANGMTYSQSGTYTASSTNSAGCPHTETLNLTVNASTSNTTTASACGSYTWSVDGMTYSASGTYTATNTNAAGCPNVETLNLTINPSNNTTTTASACGSYTWAADGMTYTASGTYTTGSGCNLQTLNLTINALPVVTAPNVSSCNGTVTLGGSPAGGTWNLPNPYTGSATSYTYFYTDANGCSASATGTITASSATVSNLQISAITGVGANATWTGSAPWYEIRWKAITASSWNPTVTSTSPNKPLTGLSPATTYTVEVRGFCSTSTPGPWIGTTFTTNNGCGTPTGLTVTNITATTAKLSWTPVLGATYYTVRHRKVGAALWNTGTVSGTSKNIAGLTANTNYEFQVAANCGTSYQTPFSASTNWTSSASRGAAVAEAKSGNLSVYPNPTQDELNIDLTVDQASTVVLKVVDMSGRVVKQIQANAFEGVNNITMSLSDLTNGIYSLQIFSNDQLTNVTRVTKN